MNRARCSCGRFVKHCACGIRMVPDDGGLFDYRKTPDRTARIDGQARRLFMRDKVGAFIDRECEGAKV